MGTQTSDRWDAIASRMQALEKGGATHEDALRAAVWEAIEAPADVVVEKSGHAISHAEATERVIDRHPDLLGLYAGQADLVELSVEEIAKQADAVKPPRPASEVYEEIQQHARALVEKSGDGLTEAAALDRVLDTPRGQQLLSEYYAPREGD